MGSNSQVTGYGSGSEIVHRGFGEETPLWREY